MNGGGYTLSAGVDGDNLTLETHSFSTNILSSSGLPDLNLDVDLGGDDVPSAIYRVTASGNGIRNGNMLILKERWDGYQSGNPNVRLNGMEMNIIAEKN